MDLQELRAEIDKIDEKLIRLINERMDISEKVAIYKKQHDLPILDPVREQEILDKISSKAGNKHKSSVIELYALLFKLSRAKQGESATDGNRKE